MQKRLSDFFKNEVERKFKAWTAALMPSQADASSPDRCCITILPDRVLLLRAHRAGPKPEITLCETLPYSQDKSLKTVLAKAVLEHHLTGIPCSWILQPEQYQLLQTEALPVAAHEFQAAIRWKVKDLLRFPIDDALIDSFPLPTAKLPTAVSMIMLVVARLSALKPLCELINAAGLRLTTIDIPELGFRNLTSAYEPDEKTTALLYLQDEISQLILTQQQKLFFSRRLDFGVASLQAASGDAKLFEQYINELTLDIQRSFDYFQGQWRQPEPARVLFSAVGPCRADFTELLSQRLNVAVSSIDPDRCFINKAMLNLQEEGCFLPLLGGMLREGNASTAAEINLYSLLPQQKKSFLSIKRLAVGYGIFLLFLVLSFGFELWTKHQLTLNANTLDAELAKIQLRMAEIKTQYPMIDPNDMENSVKRLQDELAEKNTILNLLSRDRNFSTYLTGLAKAAVPKLWLVDVQISLSEQTLTLKGYASQASAVQDFINNLALQKEFSGINFQLGEVTKIKVNKETLLNFSILGLRST